MPYIQYEYICGETIEVEKKHTGRYGAPGQKRQKRQRATPEEIARQNERNAIKKLRRKINCNFTQNDFHLILTYRKEIRPEPEEARKQISQFLKKLREIYKKQDGLLKYILTTEYKNKAIHHHLIINNLENVNVPAAVRSLWEHGRPKFVLLDDTGDYEKLAEYFVKETGQSFREPDNPNKTRYTCSRNLKEPEVRKKAMKAKSWKEDPKPKKGWYIVKETLVEGINPVTGYRYQYYTMRKIKRRK